VTELLSPKHKPTCFIYDNGPCDCGVEHYMTDEEINNELFDKEMADEKAPTVAEGLDRSEMENQKW
jgi:hypothetical protein